MSTDEHWCSHGVTADCTSVVDDNRFVKVGENDGEKTGTENKSSI